VAGVSTTTPADQGGQAATPAGAGTTTQDYTAPSSGQISLDQYQPQQIEGAFATLFKPVQQNLQAGYGELGGAVTDFNKAIGTPRTWEGIGGEGILDKALQSGAQTSDVDAATSLFNNNYVAPSLDNDRLTKAAQAYSTANPSGKALTSASNIQALMSGNEDYKHLTRGEVRGEAGNTWRNPAFAGVAQQVQKELQDYYANMNRVLGESQALGTQRTGQETAIREAAKTGLQNRYSAKEQELAGKVSEKKAQEDALMAGYDKFMAGGSDYDTIQEQLAGLQGMGVDTTGFNTESVQKLTSGQQARQAILDKYPELKGIPVMERNTNAHGKETWRFPDEWFNANKDKYTKQQMADLKNLGRLQALELVQAGFSPYVEQVIEGEKVLREGDEGVVFDNFIDYTTPQDFGSDLIFGNTNNKIVTPFFAAGQYGQVLPLYGVDDWKPDDLQNYMSLQEGTNLDPWSVASDEDLGYLNAIRGIRGEAELVDQPDYVAPSLKADTQSYQGQQAADLEQRERLINDFYAQAYGSQYRPWIGPKPYYQADPVLMLTPGQDKLEIDPRSWAWMLGSGGEGVYDYRVDPTNMLDFLERTGF
jgi:hypothetical protein